jgi:hypothetical protein
MRKLAGVELLDAADGDDRAAAERIAATL